jgi:hypothetical protein
MLRSRCVKNMDWKSRIIIFITGGLVKIGFADMIKHFLMIPVLKIVAPTRTFMSPNRIVAGNVIIVCYFCIMYSNKARTQSYIGTQNMPS